MYFGLFCRSSRNIFQIEETSCRGEIVRVILTALQETCSRSATHIKPSEGDATIVTSKFLLRKFGWPCSRESSESATVVTIHSFSFKGFPIDLCNPMDLGNL